MEVINSEHSTLRGEAIQTQLKRQSLPGRKVPSIMWSEAAAKGPRRKPKPGETTHVNLHGWKYLSSLKPQSLTS